MKATQQAGPDEWVRIHPLVVRVSHWINVVAVEPW